MRNSIFKYAKSTLLHAAETAEVAMEVLSDDDLPIITNPATFNIGKCLDKIYISFHSGEADKPANINAINHWLSSVAALKVTQSYDLFTWDCERVTVRYFVWRKS